MEIFEIKQDALNGLASRQKHSQFLQAWEWGGFQETFGNRVIRLGFREGNEVVWAVTLIKKNLPLGKSYLYAPRIGIKFLQEDQLEFIFSEIKKIANREKSVFLRFEPRSKIEMRIGEFRLAKTIDVQPGQTIILDLSKSEEHLLREMHPKTRYNIRLAEKKGVEILSGKTDKDFDSFWKLMAQTRERDQFRVHSRAYYKKMLKIGFIDLVLARYQNKVIAGNILSYFGNMATYIHGASGNEFRNVMAPYALQWWAIKKAKKEGYKYYDLYGISESKWPGVTRFKKGFGGEEINYPGTFDLVFDNMWYGIYGAVRKIRRLL